MSALSNFPIPKAQNQRDGRLPAIKTTHQNQGPLTASPPASNKNGGRERRLAIAHRKPLVPVRHDAWLRAQFA